MDTGPPTAPLADSPLMYEVVKGWSQKYKYLQQGGTFTLCRKLLCLPYLPAEHIEEAHIQPVFDYLRSTWLDSDM